MQKLTRQYQEQYREKQFYNNSIPNGISKNVKLHDEINNPLSSAAACLNVMGYLNKNTDRIIPFFKFFGLNIDHVIPFPKGADIGGEIYEDEGPIIFEWIGPKKSLLNEKGGSRGQNRTSIDAFLLAEINGKISQLLIEWKFTESYNTENYFHKFGGLKGVERLKRYTSVLTKQRNNNFPFNFKDEGSFGVNDFSYEPFYQLFRMTILAKEMTPYRINDINIENYYIVHLVHSENRDLLIVNNNHLKYSPGIKINENIDFHELWLSLLSDEEKKHFIYGYWNKAIPELNDSSKYFEKRYL